MPDAKDVPEVRLDRLERAFFGWQDVNGTYNAGLAQTLRDLTRSMSDLRAEAQARETLASMAQAKRTRTIVLGVRWLIGLGTVNFLAITHTLEAMWSWFHPIGAGVPHP